MIDFRPGFDGWYFLTLSWPLFIVGFGAALTEAFGNRLGNKALAEWSARCFVASVVILGLVNLYLVAVTPFGGVVYFAVLTMFVTVVTVLRGIDRGLTGRR